MKQHCNSCIATPGLDLKLQLLKEAKKTGTTEKELPARAIVEPLLLKLLLNITDEMCCLQSKTGAELLTSNFV
jgi:hypothetical protein